MHDGIVLCLSRVFASLKWRLPQSVIESYRSIYTTGKKFLQYYETLTCLKEILLKRRFLTGVMHVQLDNTKQYLSVRNDQV